MKIERKARTQYGSRHELRDSARVQEPRYVRPAWRVGDSSPCMLHNKQAPVGGVLWVPRGGLYRAPDAP